MSDPLVPPVSDTEASQPIPELLRLGEKLAQARALAGVSPDDLSRRLHIKPHQLKALEEGDHALLPEGVFVVAMARRVAGALHADVEEAIVAVRHSRLMRRRAPLRPAIPEARRPLEPGPPLPSPSPSIAEDIAPLAPSRPPFPWRWSLAAVLAAGGMGAAWLLSHRGVPPSSSPALPPMVQAPPPASGTPAAITPSAPSRNPAPLETDTLRLRATEPSWVEVRDVRGTTLFKGTLTGEKRFPIGRGVEVMAGRPHAVTAAIGAGPATPLGGVTDLQWKRFSPKGPQPERPPSSGP